MLTPAGDATMRCAVLGDPIEHSLSPVLHRAGYAALGLTGWEYDAVRVPAGGLSDFLSGLDGSWRGLSLTMPLKREAMALVDRVSPRAEQAGAANTLLFERSAGTGPDGLLVRGDNTDIPGAVAAIRERFAGSLGRVVIWGGGATAASALLAVAELGCRSVELLVRDPARAADTLAAAGRFPEALDVRVGRLGDAVRADLLISTIPALAQRPLLSSLDRPGAVFEVLYDPWPTALAEWASAAGLPLVSGLDLLIHQAAVQFELFTGSAAPLAAMRDAGEAALRARG